MDSELLTTTDAASRAGVSERTMRKWIASGKVGTRDTPKGRRVDRASLDAYRAEQAQRYMNGAGPGTVARPDQGPDLGVELLAEVRALRREVAELRAALLPAPVTEPPPAPVRADDPRPFWRRWLAQWTEGRP